MQTLDEVRRWLDRLQRTPHARSTQGWPLPAVLEHLAQSVEMSLDGYPQMKPAWFRASIGPLALAIFDRRGQMRHPLDAPIPGAAALDLQATDIEAAALRLNKALDRFENHTGPLAPHFAYGALDKAQFARAHVLHIANHRQWIADSV